MKKTRARKPRPKATGAVLVPARNRTPLEVKEAFVELRARGVPHRQIAERLGVGKNALTAWTKELKEEIANARALELEVLREKFYLSTERRIELFGGELERMRAELARRDYKEVPTALLVKLMLDTHEALRAEDVEPVLRTPEEIEQDRAAELVLMRLTAGTAPPRLMAPERESEGDL